MKRPFIYLVSLVFLFVCCISCEEENLLPSCEISFPENGDEFDAGAIITITAEAEDEDGTIEDVRFYIDDNLFGSSAIYPHSYQWNTSEAEEGIHKIRVTTIDDAGDSISAEIAILLIPVVIIELPELTTISISEINTTTALSGGNIISDGGAELTARGVCWSKAANPTTEDSITTDGSGTGVFTSSLKGLDPNTTYYLRAYATNSLGTAYGNEISFTTAIPVFAPEVVTNAAKDVRSTSATVGGSVSDDGGGEISDRGIWYSTTPNAEATGQKLQIGSGTGAFSTLLTGLSKGTKYYIKAYATNSAGTSYGKEISIITVVIGDYYQGGLVAYFLKTGDIGYIEGETHGIIVAEIDQATNVEWGCVNSFIDGAEDTDIGTGKQNTIAIMATCSTPGIAARICGDLDLNGYMDWYLPSIVELSMIYVNRASLGNFGNTYYWSSSQYNSTLASGRRFTDGRNSAIYKSLQYYSVRAVRSF